MAIVAFVAQARWGGMEGAAGAPPEPSGYARVMFLTAPHPSRYVSVSHWCGVLFVAVINLLFYSSLRAPRKEFIPNFVFVIYCKQHKKHLVNSGRSLTFLLKSEKHWL